MKLTAGAMVVLRNGKIRGPLRDRTSDNCYWPWGESCPHCGQTYSSWPHSYVWRPDGRAAPYDDDQEHENDIVEVVKCPQ